MEQGNEMIPRFAVRDPEDAAVLADLCDRMAAGHMAKYNDGHKCSNPDGHLDVANRFALMAIDLAAAGTFADTFAETLEDIASL